MQPNHKKNSALLRFPYHSPLATSRQPASTSARFMKALASKQVRLLLSLLHRLLQAVLSVLHLPSCFPRLLLYCWISRRRSRGWCARLGEREEHEPPLEVEQCPELGGTHELALRSASWRLRAFIQVFLCARPRPHTCEEIVFVLPYFPRS